MSTRPLRRTSAATKASEIWNARSAWLEGDWPRGIWNCSWWCITTIGTIDAASEELYALWEPLLAAFEAGLWLFCITKQLEVVLAPIPSRVVVDHQRRLHCKDGTAFVWLDYQEYYWHGETMPADLVLHPERITLDHISQEHNPELAQLMRELYEEQHRARGSD